MSEKVLVRAVDWLDDQEIRPSILHGDLWVERAVKFLQILVKKCNAKLLNQVGNTGLTQEGQITVFDPAGFVGHSEFGPCFF